MGSDTAKVEWDYSSLARFYDKRADYAQSAIDQMLAEARPAKELPIADIGAGTGKLTKLLLAAGYRVHAVEPNDEMRKFGIDNTSGKPATWSVGTGEKTGLANGAYELTTFGSSFNVTDRQTTLREVARILRPRGWFACMWNHRDLDDEVQRRCEAIIKKHIPSYSYGSRREDQTEPIRTSKLFEEPQYIEGRTVFAMSREDFVDAWRSHATLQRQAGESFARIIKEIEDALKNEPTLNVPYTTRLWLARLL